MDGEKISISLDEVNSAQVDAEIRRQDIAARMAAHQEQVEAYTPPAQRFNAGFFRKAVVYMAVFGLVASIIGWGLGEIFMCKHESIVESLVRENYYRQDLEEIQSQLTWLTRWWQVFVGMMIGFGISIAEPVVSHNGKSVAVRGLIGAGLGALGGFVCSLFINDVYRSLGGGGDEFTFKQVFARGVGWSILGAFLAIAPGIAMLNWKKFLLGLAGGAIGGLLGGLLFDPICQLTGGSAIPARFVNILGLGVGAAVATTLLEEAAKQGWLKVATGVITGKQFILYRNPTVIGSSPKAEIYLFKDPTVAPKHAAINGIGGEFLLTALNNATVLLNGRPVRQQRLRNGDQIRVGNTIFLFGARAMRSK